MARLSSDQLEEDKSLFHLLVDSVEDYAICALDADGRIASWNRGAEKINGYSAAEAIGRHFRLFFSEDDRVGGKPEQLLAAAVERGCVQYEGWRLRRDGSRFWASVVITALRAADGELVGFAKVTRDLTDRVAAEHALRVRERQIRDTQALAGLGSWEWDVATDRVTWTDELYRIYGLEPDAFAATFEAYLALVHPEDRDRVRHKVEAAYGSGVPFDFEERIVRPDGDVRVLRSRGRAVRDTSGITTHLLGACLDITDLVAARAQAVQLARESTAREAAEAAARNLSLLVEASELLLSSLDYESTLRNIAGMAVPAVADWCAVDLVLDDGSLKRVVVAHPDPEKVALAIRYSELYPPVRESDTGIWHVIERGEADFLPEITDEMLVAGARDSRQLEMLRRLGLRSYVIVPLVGRDRTLGALTFVQAESGRRMSENDVWFARELGRQAGMAIENARLHRELEERSRRLEEQSIELEIQAEDLQQQAAHREVLMTELEAANHQLERRTAEAELANRVKSDFLAAMSHELRTPLNAIFGYADLLQLGLHGPVTAAQEEALERIKRNQRALLVLVNDVLNFAKLEAGRLEIHLTEVPVRDLIGELEKVVEPLLKAKGLRYVCEPVDPELRILGEGERIEQILLNLLTNAIKFTAAAGTIELCTDSDDRAVRLRVRDSGCGIPQERFESIFDPFVQIDRQPNGSDDRGVGLGLAISRELASAMGGRLEVESVVGVGSTFTLELERAGNAGAGKR